MIEIDNWLYSVVQLFDHILRTLLEDDFFSVLLQVLVFLLIISLISSMVRMGKKV